MRSRSALANAADLTLMSEKRDPSPADPSLDEFGDRLKVKLDAKARQTAEDGQTGRARSLGAGLRIVADLVAGVVVGAGLGWMIDEVFGTSPWFLILCFLFGFAGGVSNVLRTVRAMQASEDIEAPSDDRRE
ncbi:MAG: AtpZ/AtpI family protein [Pseudomonadota bacterium]